MPSPFQPSFIAYNTTALLDRGQYDQPVGETVEAGQRRPDIKNPAFLSTVEAVESKPPFLVRAMAKSLPDHRAYRVLPGGKTEYESNEARRRLVPSSPSDFPPDVQGGRSADQMDEAFALDYRHKNTPRTAAKLSFPTDQQTFGHNRPPSFTRVPIGPTSRG